MAHPWRDLILDGPHVVTDRDHRTRRAIQSGRDVRLASLLARMGEVPFLGDDRIAAQLVP